MTVSTLTAIDAASRYARRTRYSLRQRFAQSSALLQYGFPFALGPHPTPVTRFRALARRTRFHNKGARRLLANIVMAAGWPLGALTTALRTAREMRQRHHAYGLRVLLDMYWLALRHSIPPLEYALYRFDDPERRKNKHQYVYWNDLPGLATLNAKCGADDDDVQDKNGFAAICSSHGFPHVETLAVFERGRQSWPASPFLPTAQRLWVKALRLKGGAGAAKWTRVGENYQDAQGRVLSVAELAEHFRGQDSLVQPFVENHPLIAQVSNGSLASLRIVTGINEQRRAELVASQLILPHGAGQTSVAGIICSVASETGRIGRVTLPDGTRLSHHPDTNMPIPGVRIPFWGESLELVCRAHAAAFAKFVFLGWDVALTRDGPVLLETNSGWGAIFHQMLDGPLGHTPFSRIVALHV